MLSSAWFLLMHGGWLVFLVLMIYVFYYIYMDAIHDEFLSKGDPVLLSIRISRENLQSTLAVEQIFAQLHAIYSGFTFAEVYLEGKMNFTISLEIVSLGGKVSFFVRTPRRYIGLIETAFYARYPSAEILEVTDYMTNLKRWTPEASWDVWGTEMKLIKDFPYPLKTYGEFEHPTAEEKIIDPLAALIEALNKAESHELLAVQILLRPIADSEWAPEAIAMSKKLKKDFRTGATGSKAAAPSKMGKLVREVSSELLPFLDGGSAEEEAENGQLSPGERLILEAIEHKASKPGYQSKIRLLHIAPKDRFDGSKKGAIIGSFRQLADSNLNGLKPDTNLTWTAHSYVFLKGLEQPYLDYKTESKKARFVEAYADRSMWLGLPTMVLNTEEIATLYHFPISSSEGVSQGNVDNIAVRKGQPPADLPIM